MNPAEQIKSEHRVMGKAVWSLQALAGSIKRGESVSAALLLDELAFIRGFTEKCHYRKEEGVLFPAIERELRATLSDPIPEFIQEHDESRQLTRALTQAVEAYDKGDETQLPIIASLIEEYTGLAIEHMRKATVVVLDLLENTLLADEKLEVAERFLVIEEDLGRNYHERYEQLAETMREEFRPRAA